MATIVYKRVNGYGPYAYRVTYEGGKHHWEYLGKTGTVDASPGPVTNAGSETAREDRDGDEDEDDHTPGQRVAPGETPPAAAHDRAHYNGTIDRILDGVEYPDDDDYYDREVRWQVDEVSKHYQTKHDLRVALTNVRTEQQLRSIVADIEELRDTGQLDGIEKITTTTTEHLQDRHETGAVVNAEYTPEPRDIVGNSLGYQPTVTINADTYRAPGADDGVTSYGEDIPDVRHALWHEVAHHEHLREYHDAGVDVGDVMDAGDGAVWDRMHDAMDPYRDAIEDAFGRSVRHDPVEFYAEARAREFAGEDLPTPVREGMRAVEAEQVLDEE